MLSRIQTSRSYVFKFESVVAMYPMYGEPKWFCDTWHGHRIILLTVKGPLDEVCRFFQDILKQ